MRREFCGKGLDHTNCSQKLYLSKLLDWGYDNFDTSTEDAGILKSNQVERENLFVNVGLYSLLTGNSE